MNATWRYSPRHSYQSLHYSQAADSGALLTDYVRPKSKFNFNSSICVKYSYSTIHCFSFRWEQPLEHVRAGTRTSWYKIITKHVFTEGKLNKPWEYVTLLRLRYLIKVICYNLCLFSIISIQIINICVEFFITFSGRLSIISFLEKLGG